MVRGAYVKGHDNTYKKAQDKLGKASTDSIRISTKVLIGLMSWGRSARGHPPPNRAYPCFPGDQGPGPVVQPDRHRLLLPPLPLPPIAAPAEAPGS